MLLPQDVGQSLFVSTKLDGLVSGSRVSGDLRVIARRVFLERLPLAGLSGRGTIDARLQLRDGLIESGTWQASARDLQINGEGGTRFDHATVNGHLSRAARDVLLEFEDLQLTRGARLERAPQLHVRLSLDRASPRVVRMTAEAQRLPFMAGEFFAGILAPYAAYARPAAGAGWMPSDGELRDLRFDSGAAGRRAGWSLSARVSGGALARNADQAELTQLQGTVRASARGIALAFDPASRVELKLQGASEPRIFAMGGELELLTQDSTPALRLASFTATHGDSLIEADGAWNTAKARAEPLRLGFTQVDRALMLDAWALLSTGSAPPALLAEVQGATIITGQVSLVSGADGSVNWERSRGKLELAELAMQDQALPRLTDGRGALGFARGAVQLKLESGNVDSLVLSDAQIDWPRRGAPRLRANLDGDLGSPLIREALRAPGLDRLEGKVSIEAEARGERELRQPELWRVTARLHGGSLPLGSGVPAAGNLSGTLRYSAGQLRAMELRGQWLGGLVEIESRRAGSRGSPSFVLHGVAEAAPLLELLGEAEARQRVSGQLAWSGTADPGAVDGSWQVTLSSNLAGIESRLPEPFDKLRTRALPISARLSVTPEGVRDFAVEAENLSINGQQQDGVTTANFRVRGVAGDLRHAADDRENPGLRIAELDLDAAPALLAAAGMLLPPETELTVIVDELQQGATSFGAMHAGIERTDSGVEFSIDSSTPAPHQLSARGQCSAGGQCEAEFSAATSQLAVLLRDTRLPPDWPAGSLNASGSLAWPADGGGEFVRSLTGSFVLATRGERDHQLAARAAISDGQILLTDIQGTGPAPDQVFRGEGRIGLLARDYDFAVDYERVTLAAAAVPSPARARFARAWNAVRGSVARRGWTEAPATRHVQWQGTW
jgi:hypothetical protein